jgi:hypothetical protein
MRYDEGQSPLRRKCPPRIKKRAAVSNRRSLKLADSIRTNQRGNSAAVLTRAATVARRCWEHARTHQQAESTPATMFFFVFML